MRTGIASYLWLEALSLFVACSGKDGDTAESVATVCLTTPTVDWESTYSPASPQIPARYAQIRWTNSDGSYLSATGSTDSEGNYPSDFCATFPALTSITTYLSLQSPLGSGDDVTTTPVEVAFTTGAESATTYVEAPAIYETFIAPSWETDDSEFGYCSDRPLGEFLPTLATWNLDVTSDDTDVDNGRLFQSGIDTVHDGSKTWNTEAGRGTIAGTVVSETDFSGSNIITISFASLGYDYESWIAEYSDCSEADYLGIRDSMGGFYSNLNLWVVPASTAAAYFGDLATNVESTDFCFTQSLDALASGFNAVVGTTGGIKRAMLPGAFLSGAENLAEWGNTTVGSEASGAFAGQSLNYENLGFVDLDAWSETKVAILVVDGDDENKDDIVGCWENVDLESVPSDTDGATLRLSNADFLERPFTCDGEPTDKSLIDIYPANEGTELFGETFSLNLQLVDHIETWESTHAE